FSVIVSIVAMIALFGITNYLGSRYYARFAWSSQVEMKLSPQTIFLLKSITNQVTVVAYYDPSDNLYSSVSALLDEFRLTNPKISVETVDFRRNPARAQQIKAAYKLGTSEDKNLVIFDCEGRKKILPAALLGDYTYEQVPNDKQPEWTSHLKAFEGEKWFSSALLSVINPKPRKAYFLTGHGEHDVESSADGGYQKFTKVMEENNVTNIVLELKGTNAIPADCNLLIIAGPIHTFPANDLIKIRQYLDQGGRLFVLFNAYTRHTETGLEAILADWNVAVGMNLIGDSDNTQTAGGALVVSAWSKNHPLSSPLLNSKSTLNMVLPRSISTLSKTKQGPETPKVDELASTGPNATVGDIHDNPKPAGEPVPLMVAVEKGSIKGVFPQRGTTAILVVGDSMFLSNLGIDYAENRDFAGFAINWLLDQTQMLQGVGPHPVKEYKLIMTRAQMTNFSWLLLAAVPGTILAFGGLVWFRRRH
ncbi:MAG: ABC-type uncharacterized transport system, partial [Pedosphaera sp.]|nr:ABC-type uncharacterized transport system [Pedosphaera sp.]